MKKGVLLVVLLLAGALAFASGIKGSYYQVSFTKKTLTVSLPSNPTTGYQWVSSLAVQDDCGFQSFEESYRENKASTNMVGVGGTYTVKLQNPMSDGVVVLRLEYKRSWEVDVPPVDTRKLEITVQKRRISSIKEI